MFHVYAFSIIATLVKWTGEISKICPSLDLVFHLGIIILSSILRSKTYPRQPYTCNLFSDMCDEWARLNRYNGEKCMLCFDVLFCTHTTWSIFIGHSYNSVWSVHWITIYMTNFCAQVTTVLVSRSVILFWKYVPTLQHPYYGPILHNCPNTLVN